MALCTYVVVVGGITPIYMKILPYHELPKVMIMLVLVNYQIH